MKFAERYWGYFLVLGACVYLTACGTYRMAGLSDDSEVEPAVLELPFSVMYSPIYVTYIDCESRGIGWYKRFELIPGWRAVTLSGNSQMGVAPSPKTYVFRVRPGTVYTFDPDDHGSASDWRIKLVEKETGDSIHFIWQRAEWSYWYGTTPNERLCQRVMELNAL